MGLKYNDKTGNFEEVKPSGGYSHIQNSTNNQGYHPSDSNSSDGCLDFIRKFLLLLLGCVAFFACCRTCIGQLGSSNSSNSSNSIPAYQNSNTSDFSIGGKNTPTSSSGSSYSKEPSKPEPTYRVEEYEVTCSTCNGLGVIRCQYCHGTGADPTPHTCTQCGGRGYVYAQCILCGFYGDGVCKNCGGTGRSKIECNYCGGTGTIRTELCSHCDMMKGYTQKCPSCSGSGTVKKYRTVYN